MVDFSLPGHRVSYFWLKSALLQITRRHSKSRAMLGLAALGVFGTSFISCHLFCQLLLSSGDRIQICGI